MGIPANSFSVCLAITPILFLHQLDSARSSLTGDAGHIDAFCTTTEIHHSTAFLHDSSGDLPAKQIHDGDFAIGAVGCNRNAARSGIGADTHGKGSRLLYAIIDIITHSNIVDIYTICFVRLGSYPASLPKWPNSSSPPSSIPSLPIESLRYRTVQVEWESYIVQPQ